MDDKRVVSKDIRVFFNKPTNSAQTRKACLRKKRKKSPVLQKIKNKREYSEIKDVTNVPMKQNIFFVRFENKCQILKK